jgi:hypothetical protein
MYFRGKMRGKIEFYVGNLGDIMYPDELTPYSGFYNCKRPIF